MAGKHIGNFKTEEQVELTLNMTKVENFLEFVDYCLENPHDGYYAMVDKTYDKYEKDLKTELEYIVHKYVDAFYGGYDPKYYSRQAGWNEGGLYDAFRVHVDTDDWYVEAGYEFMDPIISKSKGTDITSYIFDITIKKGYHGGAIAKSSPNPKVPYWRTGKGFSRWGDPAENTGPVYDQMVEEITKTIDKYDDACDEECKECLEQVKRIIMNRMRITNFYS